MEIKLCKKCGKELPNDWNKKQCIDCKKKRNSFIKKVLIGIGLAGVITFILSILNSSDDDDYSFDKEYTDNNDGVKNTPKYKVVMKYSDGTEEEEDDIFDTEEDAEEYALDFIGCSRQGS